MICSDMLRLGCPAVAAAAAGVRRAGKLVKLVELSTPQVLYITRGGGLRRRPDCQTLLRASFWHRSASHRDATQHNTTQYNTASTVHRYVTAHRQTSDTERP